MRVAMLVNILSPYRIPLFRDLQDTNGWNFKVFTCAETEKGRDWTIEADGLQVKRSWSLSWVRTIKRKGAVDFTQRLTYHFPFGVLWDLMRFRPDVVVSAELGVRTFLAVLYSMLFRSQLIIWWYSTKVSAQGSSWRQWLRRQMLNRADAVIGMGTDARRMLKSLDVPEEKIFDTMNASPVAPRQTPEGVGKLTVEETHYLREKMSARQIAALDGRRIVCCPGRLIPVKGTLDVLQAWRSLPQEIRDLWALVIAGNGQYKEDVEAASEQDPSILYVGHLDGEEMADLYHVSDLALFNSYGDVWGLIANEAMSCGVPVLSSVYAGCTVDLIEHATNGWRFRPDSRYEFRTTLEAAMRHPDLAGVGERARETLRAFTIGRMSLGIREAVNRATTGGVDVRAEVDHA
ncbi:MAG: glycosyltransferase family 4 protein [Phycisphaerae bacterium]